MIDLRCFTLGCATMLCLNGSGGRDITRLHQVAFSAYFNFMPAILPSLAISQIERDIRA